MPDQDITGGDNPRCAALRLAVRSVTEGVVLTAEEAAELSARLRGDATARSRFLAAAAFHAQLHAAADALTLDAAGAGRTVAFPSFNRPLGLVAALLAIGLTVSSFGWLLAARSDRAETRPRDRGRWLRTDQGRRAGGIPGPFLQLGRRPERNRGAR